MEKGLTSKLEELKKLDFLAYNEKRDSITVVFNHKLKQTFTKKLFENWDVLKTCPDFRLIDATDLLTNYGLVGIFLDTRNFNAFSTIEVKENMPITLKLSSAKGYSKFCILLLDELKSKFPAIID